MRLLFELSGEHGTLPRSEVLACIEAEGYDHRILEEEDRILILETDAGPERLGQRVALAHVIGEYVSSGTISELVEDATNLDIEGTIAIRMKEMRPKQERVNADEALERVGSVLTKGRDVDLDEPDNEFRLILGVNNYLGLQKARIDRSSFEQRKVDNRPFFSPVSLHPKYARALVNLARASVEETLLDPFCGTGGILIEAGLIGAKPIGIDVKEEMIEGCRKNLQKYEVPSTLYQSDVGEIGEHVKKVPSIATDPPYGRSSTTMKEDPSTLYERSFGSFRDVLEDDGFLAIALPNEESIELGKKFLRLEEVHKQKVHGSLDRFYCVFRNH
jgi:tRNA (guanine10-N2)-dimethyltransferase